MNDGLLISPLRSIEPASRDRVAALASVTQRRPIVLVLGMHRSGSSLCSHILSALGVDMTDNIAGPGNTSLTPDNPHGHWERWEIVEFHDRILGLFNRDYLGRFHDFPLPVAWWADPRVAQIRREMAAFLEKRMGEDCFGFKDPRTVRLLPVWHQIFNELKLAPKIVLCLRNPAQVARSLNARDGLDPTIGEYRWLVHTVDLFRYANSSEMCTVEYEGWFGEPASNLEKLKQFLGLPWQQSESELGMMLSGIIDSTARHDDRELREASQPLVRSLYKLAKRAGTDRETHEQIAYIASQFVGFQQLQRPFQQAYEDIAKTAAGEREERAVIGKVVQRELAFLRDALVQAERDAQRRADEAAAIRAEITQERVAIAVEPLEAELGMLRGKLAVNERDAVGLAAAAAAMQDEMVKLRNALADAERTGREGAAAADTLRGEVGVLRAGLAEAESAAMKRAAEAETLRGEVGALRDRLAKAESEATDRAAATAALKEETETLQVALIAARQVGKAAIAALKVGGAGPAKPDEETYRWRQAIMRLFGARVGF